MSDRGVPGGRGQSRREWIHTIAGAAAALAFPACARWRQPDPDVCIVGSGPAGAILAFVLASRGVRTLLLEGGPNPARRSGTSPREPVDLNFTSPIRYPLEETRFLGDGGTSNLWGGECPRCQPDDFALANPYRPADAAWPVEYADLEPHYQRAEAELSIAGGWPNTYSPPRTADFPVPVSDVDSSPCLRDLFGRAGCLVEPVPRSTSHRMTESHLPRFADLPAATFRRDVRVRRIVTDASGQVSHLDATDADGRSQPIRARFYVLACGGVETPRLLLGSHSDAYPRGLGNDHEQVGRHFMEHLTVPLGTYRLPARPSCAGDETAISWQFAGELKRLGLGSAVLELDLSPADSLVQVDATIEMRPSASNRVTISRTDRDAHGDPLADLTLTIGDDERRTFRRMADIALDLAGRLGAATETPPSARFYWCHHHMGTCRMGRDPRTSVIDVNQKMHAVDNLYVSGSAAFVTAGAGSPTLLLTALGLRLADHLVARVRGS